MITQPPEGMTYTAYPGSYVANALSRIDVAYETAHGDAQLKQTLTRAKMSIKYLLAQLDDDDLRHEAHMSIFRAKTAETFVDYETRLATMSGLMEEFQTQVVEGKEEWIGKAPLSPGHHPESFIPLSVAGSAARALVKKMKAHGLWKK
jgi:hypothetical protein